MTENITNQSPLTDQAKKPTTVGVKHIYLKSQQFVVAGQPEDLSKDWRPELSLQANPRYIEQSNNQYEVIVTLNLSAQQNGKMLFQWQVDQAGLFILENMAVEQREMVLYGVCPNALFPYIGVGLNQLLSQAGLPPLYLNPLDFVQLYRQHQTEQMNKAQQELSEKKDQNEMVLQ